jgi:hypothetical protein
MCDINFCRVRLAMCLAAGTFTKFPMQGCGTCRHRQAHADTERMDENSDVPNRVPSKCESGSFS